MPVALRTQRIHIPPGRGRRTFEDTVTFSSGLLRSGIALGGFNLDYDEGDNRMNHLEVDTDFTSLSSNGSGGTTDTVGFWVVCEYADRDNTDTKDNYHGYVDVLVIAEPEWRTTGPRGKGCLKILYPRSHPKIRGLKLTPMSSQ